MAESKNPSEQAITTQVANDPAKPGERPPRPLTGDKGQDDAYATESNPEGLRYGEKPHKPGELPPRPAAGNDDCDEPRISVGES